MQVETTGLRFEMKEGLEGLYRLLLTSAVVIIAALIGLIGVSAF